MLKTFKYKNYTFFLVSILAVFTTTVFLITCIFGEGLGGSLGLNQSCLKYLGCSIGFFGYDALEHFLFGVSATFIIIWIFKTFPQHSFFSTKKWKNILTIIVLVMFISVIWEFIEFFHDIFRFDIFDKFLINQKLNINLLDQPNNIDTMGDLFFSLCGSVIPLFFIKISNTEL